MSEPTTPQLPKAYFEFAKAIAAAAKFAGIDRFHLSFRPGFEIRREGSSMTGEIKIDWALVDGRGRPSENLQLSFESTVRHQIIATSSSHD